MNRTDVAANSQAIDSWICSGRVHDPLMRGAECFGSVFDMQRPSWNCYRPRQSPYSDCVPWKMSQLIVNGFGLVEKVM